MKQNRELMQLKNIGTKLAERLKAIGISSEDALRLHGAVETHKKLKEESPDETLPFCYYLYSLKGALCDKHCNKIGEKRKQALLNEIDE